VPHLIHGSGHLVKAGEKRKKMREKVIGWGKEGPHTKKIAL